MFPNPFRQTVLLATVFIGAATIFAGSARATIWISTCQFTAVQTECLGPSGTGWSTLPGGAPGSPPLQLSDKRLNISSYSFDSYISTTLVKPTGHFNWSWIDSNTPSDISDDEWSFRTVFDSTISGLDVNTPATGAVNYTVQIVSASPISPIFRSVAIDSAHSGTGVRVDKAISGLLPSPYLSSIEGSMDIGPLGGQFVNVTDTYTVASTGGLNSFNNAYTQLVEVPGPMPLLGVAAAFGCSRKLRKRIARRAF